MSAAVQSAGLRNPAQVGRDVVVRLRDPACRAELRGVLALCGIALALRALVMWLTIDVPGDGPTHAASAYAWSKHPYVATHGVWLPGFTYWAGVATWVVDNPLIAPRLLNVGFGVLTIPAFYALVRRLFGPSVAFLSAATLVVLPLHVGLSASSLTEPSFLLFLLLALAGLASATSGEAADRTALGVFLVCTGCAEVLRYEVWPLVPLMLAYMLVRLRRPTLVIPAAAILLAFPAAWSAGNYLAFHDPLYGLLQGARPLEGGGTVSMRVALTNVVSEAGRHLGWLLSAVALAGLIGEVVRAARRTISAERTGYALLVLAVWTLNVGGARSVGPALYDRYLLLGYVLILPYAAAIYLRYGGHYQHCIAIGVVGSLLCVIAAYSLYRPVVFVTRDQPTEMIALAHWLARTPYRNETVVMTRMQWQSTYLPLYLPQLIERCLLVSVWVDDGTVERFVRERRPQLLITRADDAPQRARLERIMGRAIGEDARIYEAGGVTAYDLSRSALPPGG